MRGLLASILALALNAPVLGMLATSSPAPLPACCRRDGKHRCMTARVASPDDPAFAVPHKVCPRFPQGAVVSPGGSFQAPTRFAFLANAVSHPVDLWKTESRQGVWLGGSHQKRGPPAFLS